MLLTKLKLATAAVLVAAVSGSVAVWFAATVRANAPEPARVEDKAKPSRIVVGAILKGAGTLECFLLSVDPETGKTKKLTDLQANYPRVLPDRQTVVFCHENAIWNCDAGGSNNPGKLCDLPDGYGGPVWSADGKYLYRSKVIPQLGNNVWNHETWRYDANGRNPVKIDLPPGDAVLDVSRDGKLVLTRSRVIVRLNTSQLRVMKLDGTEARQLSELGGFNEPGRFSPDGKRVAWIRNHGDLSIIGVDGKNAKEILSEAGTHLRDLAWSPDGKRLAVVAATYGIGPDGQQNALGAGLDNHWRVEVLDADGENRRELKIEGEIRWVSELDWHAVAE